LRKRYVIPLISALILCLIFPVVAEVVEANHSKADDDIPHPVLLVEEAEAETAVAGETFYVRLVVENLSEDGAAHNVFADVDSPDTTKTYFDRDPQPDHEEPDLDKIDAGERRSLTIPVDVSPDAERDSYRMLLTLRSQNVISERAPSASVSMTVDVSYETLQPVLRVDRVTLDPEDPQAGEAFDATFHLENRGTADASALDVAVDGMDHFNVRDVSNRRFVESLPSGDEKAVTFELESKDNREDNQVQLDLQYDHRGDTGDSETLTVNLPFARPAAGESPLLTVESFELEGAGDAYRGRLNVKNLGEQEARDIALSLKGEGLSVLGRSNVKNISSIGGGETKELTYTLGISPSEAEYLDVQVEMDYLDPRGNERPTVREEVGISQGELAGGPAATGKPRVLISEYELDPREILAGSEFGLTLAIENTHDRPIQNVKGSIEPQGMEGNGTGGTVFSPVKGSNSFFIRNIEPRTAVEHEMELYVDPGADPQTYIVPVELEYEAQNGQSYNETEHVSMSVTQESRFDVLSVEVPPMAHVGEPTTVSAEFVNSGKVDLGNFTVAMEGDFPMEESTYYVGNLESDSSDFFQGIIHPDQEGVLEGELVFSYDDHRNEEVEVREPFEMTVEPPPEIPDEEAMPPEHQEEPGTGSFFLNPLVIMIVLGGIVGLVLFLRRRASKKKEEEEMLDA